MAEGTVVNPGIFCTTGILEPKCSSLRRYFSQINSMVLRVRIYPIRRCTKKAENSSGRLFLSSVIIFLEAESRVFLK